MRVDDKSYGLGNKGPREQVEILKQKDNRIMELEVILDDTKIFLKTIGTLKPLIVDNCKKLIKKIENAGI
jgi:hypothetical protein